MNYSCFGSRYWVKMGGSLVEKLNFQAVIKSAALDRKPKPREGSSRERPEPSSESDPSSGRPRRPTVPRRPGAPLELPSLDFAFGEAALAADLITA